jgi:hypothetical protein
MSAHHTRTSSHSLTDGQTTVNTRCRSHPYAPRDTTTYTFHTWHVDPTHEISAKGVGATRAGGDAALRSSTDRCPLSLAGWSSSSPQTPPSPHSCILMLTPMPSLLPRPPPPPFTPPPAPPLPSHVKAIGVVAIASVRAHGTHRGRPDFLAVSASAPAVDKPLNSARVSTSGRNHSGRSELALSPPPPPPPPASRHRPPLEAGGRRVGWRG